MLKTINVFATTASVLTVGMCLLLGNVASAIDKNGFNLDDSLIPPKEILQGGPPRDGIPSIDKPKYVGASAASFMKPKDRLLGIVVNEVPYAYPINILNWHEIVNDTVEGLPLSVTYCPLCGTGLVYKANIDGKTVDFGVSGLLYNSDVLLYDRQTESLWSQILSKSINGPMKGRKLETIPVWQTSWAQWQKKHPNTKVLSTDTGFNRNYTRSPYGDYDDNMATFFPLSAESRRYHPKERVLGVTINGKHKAYPITELGKLGKQTLMDSFQGQQLTIEFDVPNRDGQIKDASGNILSIVNGFWFAWYAFHPDTEVFTAK